MIAFRRASALLLIISSHRARAAELGRPLQANLAPAPLAVSILPPGEGVSRPRAPEVPASPLESLDAAESIGQAASQSHGPAETAADAGLPFDSGVPRASAIASPAASPIAAMALFSPLPPAAYARRAFEPVSYKLKAPRETGAAAISSREDRLERQPAAAKMSLVQGTDGRGLSFRLTYPAAGQREAAGVHVAVAAKKDVAAWTDGRRIWVADAAGGTILARFDPQSAERDPIGAISLSADGKTLAYLVPGTESSVVGYADLASGRTKRLWLGSAAGQIALSPRGDALAVTGRYGDLFVWEFERARILPYDVPGWTKTGPAPVFSADGTRLALGNDRGEVYVVTLDPRAPARARLDTGGSGLIGALALGETGRAVAASVRGELWLWDLDRQEAFVLNRSGERPLALGWDAPGRALTWATADALRRAELDGGKAALTQLGIPYSERAALRPDGSLAAYASQSHGEWTVQTFRLPPAKRPAPPVSAANRATIEEIKRELMGRIEVHTVDAVVPRLFIFAVDSLEIFRVAGRKWLTALAALGDESAAAALAEVSDRDMRAPAPRLLKRPRG